MQINPIQLNNKQNLINDYRQNHPDIMQYFDYRRSADDMKQRLKDLEHFSFKRTELVAALTKLNQNWDAPLSTIENIKRLNNKESVVVIGGQQAGLLTGPMYTVNKVISIIQYAKQQEEHLKVPVIPVFWIAGEDHDFEEINHIFLPEKQRMKKFTTAQYTIEKRSVSDIPLDKDKTVDWLENILKELQETEYTKSLTSTIKRCLEKSYSYVDFFARLIFQLFDREGLVLIDSNSKDIRQIESNYFLKLIEKQEQISTGVYGALSDLKRSGYNVNLETEVDNAHLFYHSSKSNERILLFKTEKDNWVGKYEEVELTTEELKEIAKNNPQQLSNNVITRPLMQELLFPTLAFIGGPGEISYWAALKPAFHSIGLKMPPVIPRLSLTYINQRSIKLMEKYSVELSEAINNGLEHRKKAWLSAKMDPPVEETASEIKRVINEAHKPLRELAHSIRDDLGALSEKNLNYLYRDIEFLEKRISSTLEEQYRQQLNEFEILNNLLHPQKGLQERVWNPISFINHHGTDFINELTNASLSFGEEHFLVCI